MELKRAFVYDRTSVDHNGRGTGTRDQNTENERFCKAHDLTIAGRFTDPGRSASRHARKRRDDYERMVEGIGRGECDVLVVWEASRAYRDLEVYVALRKLCVENGVVLCYDGTFYDLTRGEDRYRTGQDALQAEREADKIRDRNLRTARLAAERGGPHGRIPYGYRRIYDPDTGALLEQIPHEEHAEILREIAKRAVGGDSCKKIAESLNSRGIPSPTGLPWAADTLPRLLVKPSNIGRRQHQGEVIGDATWPGILDEELYYACVRLFTDPARRTSHDTAVKYLLSGIPRCSLCKGVHRSRPGARKAMKYTCTSCFKTTIGIGVLDDIVTLAVLEHVERPEFAEALLQRGADDAGRAALAEAQALEAQIAQARELAATWDAEHGRLALSAVSLANLERQLLPRIEAARARAQSASVPTVLRQIAGPRAREYWAAKDADLLWRRSVIKAVVVPWMNPAGKGTRTVKPGRYDLEWLH